MRRVIVLLGLAALLVVAFAVRHLTWHWHYVLPAEPGQVLYVATFDDFTADWDQYQGILSAQVLDGGVLRLTASDAYSGPFSAARPHFGDFDLRVRATPVEGPLDNGYGVIFRLQDKRNDDPTDDSYYWFFISSDGYYQVVRTLAGRQKRLSDWIPSPLIQQGMGAANWLRVVASGDRFRFYINGEPVLLCVPDNPDGESTYQEYGAGCVDGQMVHTLEDASIASGRIGVIAQVYAIPPGERGLVVDFDTLIVFGPEE